MGIVDRDTVDTRFLIATYIASGTLNVDSFSNSLPLLCPAVVFFFFFFFFFVVVCVFVVFVVVALFVISVIVVFVVAVLVVTTCALRGSFIG